MALSIYALILAIRAPQSRMPGSLNKIVWSLFIALLPIIGPLTFLIAYLLGNYDKPTGGARPRGPVAPDDDPEFLKKLDEELRHRSYDKKLREHENPDDETA